MNINLEYYKIFYYVGKLGGITLAAKELSISQPAVSQAVKLLEEELNTRLFIRTSKGVKLTAEGKVLYKYVSRGYESIKKGERKLSESLDLESGEIHIGASDMTLQFYLLPYLEAFHEAYPKITVRVTNAPTPETLEYMKEGKIDFGVISSPFEERKEFKAVRVREVQDIFVAGSKFAHLKDKILDYTELETLPVICLEQRTSTRKYLDEFLARKDVTLSPEFELATSYIIVQFARQNLGIGSVVEDFAREQLDTGELFQLQFKEKIPSRSFYTVTNRRNPPSAAAVKLLRTMVIYN